MLNVLIYWLIVWNKVLSIYHSYNMEHSPDDVTISFDSKTTQFGNDGFPILIPL